MEERIIGICKWFSAERGYGFVIREDDPASEYFAHYSSIEMEGYRTLKAGQKVSFILVDTDKGIQAKEVRAESS